MAFDIIQASAAVGSGANFAFDTFTDTDAVSKTMAYSALAFGAENGPYTRVNTGAGLPVVLQAGTEAFGKLAANSGVIIGAVEIAAAQTVAVTGTFWQATQPVSGTVTASLSAATNAGAAAKTSDYDTGAGTDTVTMFGIALPASGGAVQGGTATNPIRTDPTGTTAQPVTNTGTFVVQAAQSGTWNVTNAGTFAVQATISGTPAVDTELPAAAALADAAGNPTTPLVGDCLMVFNGTTWDRARGDTTNGLDVDVTRLPALVAGTANIGDVDVLTLPAITIAAAQTLATVTTVGAVTGITNALPAGDNNIGNVDIVTLPALVAGTALIGKVGIDQTTPGTTNAVQDIPGTSGGLTMHKTVSAASTNATSVKGSAGQVYEIMASNVNAAARYLKLYDKATAPTVGTDTPVWTLIIPGNTAGGGIAKSIPKGLVFTLGIAFALTTEATDAGTTGVAANELVVNLGYK